VNHIGTRLRDDGSATRRECLAQAMNEVHYVADGADEEGLEDYFVMVADERDAMGLVVSKARGERHEPRPACMPDDAYKIVVISIPRRGLMELLADVERQQRAMGVVDSTVLELQKRIPKVRRVESMIALVVCAGGGVMVAHVPRRSAEGENAALLELMRRAQGRHGLA